MFCCSCNVESLLYFGSIFLSAAEVHNSTHHSADNSTNAAWRETTGPSFIYNAFVNPSQNSICLFCKSIKLFIHIRFRRHSNPFKSHLHRTKKCRVEKGGTEGFQEVSSLPYHQQRRAIERGRPRKQHLPTLPLLTPLPPPFTAVYRADFLFYNLPSVLCFK